MADSKQARKKAEEDVQLLKNRIRLLQLEEEKASKKIEVTKKKTNDVATVQQRNQEMTQKKDQERHRQMEVEEQKRQKNQNYKHELESALNQSKQEFNSKKAGEIQSFKQQEKVSILKLTLIGEKRTHVTRTQHERTKEQPNEEQDR